MTQPLPLSVSADYADWLALIKARVQAARTRAVLAVHREQLELYLEIGRAIREKQSEHGWGAGIVEKLAVDLKHAFPDAKGFSVANLRHMRKLAEVCAEDANLSQVVRDLPWGHCLVLLYQLKTNDIRLWYAREAIAQGWSRAVFGIQIETRLHERQGKAVSNFGHTLPPPYSELVQQATKDPYIFDFLGIGSEAHERDIENALTTHVTRFLLELGAGFSYVGRQVPLQVGGEDFYIDLLFYHLKLRCYIVLELKAVPFKPEFAGKLNFYLSAVDGEMKHPADNPTVGMLLCKTKNKVLAEYALKDINKPIGIAEYRLTESIPENLRGKLPSIEELEAALRSVEDAHDV
jgi:predicted nuclease of restriction endonuclease-like (RecB) superfamily